MDLFLKILLFIYLLGGVVVWFVHIYSWANDLPTTAKSRHIALAAIFWPIVLVIFILDVRKELNNG